MGTEGDRYIDGSWWTLISNVYKEPISCIVGYEGFVWEE